MKESNGMETSYSKSEWSCSFLYEMIRFTVSPQTSICLRKERKRKKKGKKRSSRLTQLKSSFIILDFWGPETFCKKCFSYPFSVSNGFPTKCYPLSPIIFFSYNLSVLQILVNSNVMEDKQLMTNF